MLTELQKSNIEKFASENKWALNHEQYINCVNEYEHAIKTNNQYKIDCISYLLDDINYHGALKLLEENEFEEARKWH